MQWTTQGKVLPSYMLSIKLSSKWLTTAWRVNQDCSAKDRKKSYLIYWRRLSNPLGFRHSLPNPFLACAHVTRMQIWLSDTPLSHASINEDAIKTRGNSFLLHKGLEDNFTEPPQWPTHQPIHSSAMIWNQINPVQINPGKSVESQ